MAKKIFFIICIFILTGCGSNKISVEKEKYNNSVDILQGNTVDSVYLPLDIEVYVDKIIDTEVMYRVIMDKPKIALRSIEAIVIHDKYTEDIFPSSGIFEDKYSLIPGLINKDSNYVEGIILVGYIPFDKDISLLDATFKILIKYIDDEEMEHTIIYSTKK